MDAFNLIFFVTVVSNMAGTGYAAGIVIVVAFITGIVMLFIDPIIFRTSLSQNQRY